MTIQSYSDAVTVLNGKETKRIAANTVLNKNGDDIAITLYDINVLVYRPDNTLTVNTGKFNTKTTRSRIDEYSPLQTKTVKKELTIRYNGETYKHFDGLTIQL